MENGVVGFWLVTLTFVGCDMVPLLVLFTRQFAEALFRWTQNNENISNGEEVRRMAIKFIAEPLVSIGVSILTSFLTARPYNHKPS